MAGSVLPPVPALVVGTVRHRRHTPTDYAFAHRHAQWLVDVDALPRLPRWLRWTARFDAADHFDGRLPLRAAVAKTLRAAGQELADDDRVWMLAHPQVAGHVFNPLSVFWVLQPDGRQRLAILEVHNTYGQRHAYLVTDPTGTDTLLKEFYVSPFNELAGEYAIRLRLDARRVAAAIVLTRDGQRVLSASVTGIPIPATRRAVAKTFARHAFMTQRVSLLIRWHGIRLWAKRLPIQPRPVAQTDRRGRESRR